MANSNEPIAVIHVTKTMLYLDDAPVDCYDILCYSVEEFEDNMDKLFYESECCNTCVDTRYDYEELIEGSIPW